MCPKAALAFMLKSSLKSVRKGLIHSCQILLGSGSRRFDNAVTQMFANIGPFKAPPTGKEKVYTQRLTSR